MNIGDAVSIACAPGLVMIVTEVGDDKDWVECTWFDSSESEFNTYTFPPEALTKLAPKLAEAAE